MIIFLHKITSYTICHLQLEDHVLENSLPNVIESAYYYVFWWGQIPIGHIYIERNEHLSSTYLQKRAEAVIKPTLDFYLNKANILNEHKREILNSKLVRNEFMKEAFLPFQAASVPEKVDISVIICTRNRSESLLSCLKSLHQQVCMPEEIIVVDNAPDDDSTKKIVEQFPAALYYRENRLGLDIARNTGAKKAKCSIVAYTDDDVCVHEYWTYRIWEILHTGRVAAITGLIISSSLDTESQQIFEKYWGFNKGYIHKSFNNDFLNSVHIPRVWDIGAGANMAFCKRVLEEVSWFDERLDVGAAGCSGDSEIWYRILAAGYTIQYTPLAVVYHTHRKEMSALRKQIFNYMRGHAASVLIQDIQNNKIGYKKYLFNEIPRYYLLLLRSGFPSYSYRYSTLLYEIKGVISGIIFFYRNKKKPRIS